MTIIRRRDLLALVVLATWLPDLFGQSWTIFSRMRQVRRLGIRKAFDMNVVFSEMELMTYRLFHSFFAWGIFTTLLYLFLRDYLILSLAYLSHILIDIPAHQGIWATRIFYPFSDFHFEGRNWWQSKRVVLASCGLLLLANLVVLVF
jgi:hypothetical protein